MLVSNVSLLLLWIYRCNAHTHTLLSPVPISSLPFSSFFLQKMASFYTDWPKSWFICLVNYGCPSSLIYTNLPLYFYWWNNVLFRGPFINNHSLVECQLFSVSLKQLIPAAFCCNVSFLYINNATVNIFVYTYIFTSWYNYVCNINSKKWDNLFGGVHRFNFYLYYHISFSNLHYSQHMWMHISSTLNQSLSIF